MHLPNAQFLKCLPIAAVVSIFVMAPTVVAQAQPSPAPQDAAAAGSAIVSPFVPIEPSAAELRPGDSSPIARYRLDPEASRFFDGSPDFIEMELPVGEYRTAIAGLGLVEPLASGAVLFIADADGHDRAAACTARVWRGQLAGEPDSEVFLGISDAQAHGWIVSGGRTTLLTTDHRSGHPIVLAFDASLVQPEATPVCSGAIDIPGMDAPPPTPLIPGMRSGTTCRAFDIALEGDQEFRHTQPTPQAAVDYAVILTAASSSIFSREAGMGLRISYLRIWNREDPWTESGSGAQLTQVRDYWLTNMADVPRSTVHLLSGRSLGGGVAYVRTACDNQWSYAVSGNLAGQIGRAHV